MSNSIFFLPLALRMWRKKFEFFIQSKTEIDFLYWFIIHKLKLVMHGKYSYQFHFFSSIHSMWMLISGQFDKKRMPDTWIKFIAPDLLQNSCENIQFNKLTTVRCIYFLNTQPNVLQSTTALIIIFKAFFCNEKKGFFVI